MEEEVKLKRETKGRREEDNTEKKKKRILMNRVLFSRELIDWAKQDVYNIYTVSA